MQPLHHDVRAARREHGRCGEAVRDDVADQRDLGGRVAALAVPAQDVVVVDGEHVGRGARGQQVPGSARARASGGSARSACRVGALRAGVARGQSCCSCPSTVGRICPDLSQPCWPTRRRPAGRPRRPASLDRGTCGQVRATRSSVRSACSWVSGSGSTHTRRACVSRRGCRAARSAGRSRPQRLEGHARALVRPHERGEHSTAQRRHRVTLAVRGGQGRADGGRARRPRNGSMSPAATSTTTRWCRLPAVGRAASGRRVAVRLARAGPRGTGGWAARTPGRGRVPTRARRLGVGPAVAQRRGPRCAEARWGRARRTGARRRRSSRRCRRRRTAGLPQLLRGDRVSRRRRSPPRTRRPPGGPSRRAAARPRRGSRRATAPQVRGQHAAPGAPCRRTSPDERRA